MSDVDIDALFEPREPVKKSGFRKALPWLIGAAVVAAAIAGLIIVFGTNSGESTDTPLSTLAADDRSQTPKNVKLEPAARRVAKRFIETAVARKNLKEAYSLAGPQIVLDDVVQARAQLGQVGRGHGAEALGGLGVALLGLRAPGAHGVEDDDRAAPPPRLAAPLAHEVGPVPAAHLLAAQERHLPPPDPEPAGRGLHGRPLLGAPQHPPEALRGQAVERRPVLHRPNPPLQPVPLPQPRRRAQQRWLAY